MRYGVRSKILWIGSWKSGRQKADGNLGLARSMTQFPPHGPLWHCAKTDVRYLMSRWNYFGVAVAATVEWRSTLTLKQSAPWMPLRLVSGHWARLIPRLENFWHRVFVPTWTEHHAGWPPDFLFYPLSWIGNPALRPDSLSTRFARWRASFPLKTHGNSHCCCVA